MCTRKSGHILYIIISNVNLYNKMILKFYQAISKMFVLLEYQKWSRGKSCLLSMSSLVTWNVRSVTKTMNLCDLPAFCLADSRNRETKKVKEQPIYITMPHTIAAILGHYYIIYNNVLCKYVNKVG